MMLPTNLVLDEPAQVDSIADGARQLYASVLHWAIRDWDKLMATGFEVFFVPPLDDKDKEHPELHDSFMVDRAEMVTFWNSLWFEELCDWLDIDVKDVLRKCRIVMMPEPYWKQQAKKRKLRGKQTKGKTIIVGETKEHHAERDNS